MAKFGSVMKFLIFFTAFLKASLAGPHSLQYFYTGVTSGLNFPEFTLVGQVDGQQFIYYDSNIRKVIPKTKWIEKNEGQDYWDRETQNQQGHQETFKTNVGTAMQRFNQSTGVHTVQWMYGCEIDDAGITRGYTQFGYDGEDFISLDLKTVTWVAPTPQALISKYKLDATGVDARYQKNYLENICIEWLRKHVSYGRDTLERKVRPEASVFQRHSSSPELVCQATGFFPKSVRITWQKDGEDVHEDVELRETLPNQDGSFPEEKYSESGALIGNINGIIAGLLVLVLVVVGIVVWMKMKKSGFKPVPSGASSEGDSSSNKS